MPRPRSVAPCRAGRPAPAARPAMRPQLSRCTTSETICRAAPRSFGGGGVPGPRERGEIRARDDRRCREPRAAAPGASRPQGQQQYQREAEARDPHLAEQGVADDRAERRRPDRPRQRQRRSSSRRRRRATPRRMRCRSRCSSVRPTEAVAAALRRARGGASLPRQADSTHASTSSPNSHIVAAKWTARADASRTFIAVRATRSGAGAQRATSKV